MKRYIAKVSDNLFLLNFLPVLFIHTTFLVFWIIFSLFPNLPTPIFMLKILLTTFTTLSELLFDTFIIPILLLIFNYKYCIRRKKYMFMGNMALIIIASFVGNLAHYFNWGITTGRLLNPDFETIFLFIYSIGISSIIIITGSSVSQVILLIKGKARRK